MINKVIIIPIFLFTLFSNSIKVRGIEPILNDSALLVTIEQYLSELYNFNFDSAYELVKILEKERPEHPVTSFYSGIHIYWRNYPLTQSKSESTEFINLMEETSERVIPLLKENENEIEGVFFDIISKAFLMMYYSDNGLSGKVIKIAPTVYKHVMQSFELNDIFREFYFITGLYNYYIEAYPEKNPVYKPISLMFRSGNKDLGLRQLHYAKDSTIFMCTESAVFLSLIYYDFEEDIRKAIVTMGELYKSYPNNPFFLSQYIEYLLYDKQYAEVIRLNKEMVRKHRDNAYIVMKGIIFKAIIEEKYHKNYDTAYENYKSGKKIAKTFGAQGEDFLSYAYYGLSRLESIKGNVKKSKEYSKMGHSLARYDHFSD